jgi:hypothetical protein
MMAAIVEPINPLPAANRNRGVSLSSRPTPSRARMRPPKVRAP